MSSQYEQLKTEVRELAFFTLKLLFHWLALTIILIFVLITLWIHQFFRKSYSTLEGPRFEAREAEAGVGSGNSTRERLVETNQVRRRRARPKRTVPAPETQIIESKSDPLTGPASKE